MGDEYESEFISASFSAADRGDGKRLAERMPPSPGGKNPKNPKNLKKTKKPSHLL